MQKLIELEIDSNILVSSHIINYDKSELIYIPIDADTEILVRKNSHVKIGTPLLKNTSKTIKSSISGSVNDIKKVNTLKGNVDALEIINDYQEKMVNETSSKRNLNKLTKETFDDILLANFNIDFKDKRNLILNCIDDEPYVLTENFNLLLYYDDFLEILDKISKVYQLEKIVIAVKSTSSENITKLMNCLGMYPNISLEVVPNLYLLGHNEFLLNHLALTKENTIVIKSSLFYNIYNLIKRKRPVTDKLITISGNGLNNPSVVKVKIGSKLKDVLLNFNILDNVIYVANGLMQGSVIKIDDFIITSDLNSILIMKNKEINKEEECLNCGACIDICPVNINPLLLKKNKVIDKCLKCGLCSYICPVYINFNKEIKGDSHE